MRATHRSASLVLLLLVISCGSGNGARLGCGARCPEGMVLIPAGTFEMGTNFEHAFADERPVHKVTLSAFCLDRTEVTLDAYAQCAQAGKCGKAGGTGLYGCGKLPEHSGRPMNCVTWNQSVAFCKARGARLPTEAEWEYAARGTDGRLYPWGNEAPDRTRFWAGSTEFACPGCPTKVGSFPAGASPFGVLDMVGNVLEWVADYHAHYPAEPQTNPLQNVPPYPRDPTRVQRGGDGGFGKLAVDERDGRVTRRYSMSEHYTHTGEGFRCAQPLAP
jgi:formylglycine-generating enzyme required for sulfatase activity